MSTEEIRESFLIDTLFAEDSISMVYSDRGSRHRGLRRPGDEDPLPGSAPELRAETFCERRELGVSTSAAPEPSRSTAWSTPWPGVTASTSAGAARPSPSPATRPETPARYYLLSFPAHAAHPTVRIRQSEAEAVRLGSSEAANQRTLYKLIHPGGARSCQLVMGFTVLEPGCVWNTMPPHTHERRMEVYLYFDLPADARVFHFMGRPEATRHLVVADGQAVISPSWSIHCGVGTGAYAFCWGMGGENQAFDDMDHLTLDQLR